MPPLTLFKTKYADLIGRKYGTLNEKEKQTVYAMALYNDGADAMTADDIFSSKTLSADFVDQQNRNTFEYEDNSTIR